MMEYISLYRKWRPATFAEVRGQEPIVQTLTNALEQGRIAHAYLFAGPRGTGKTSTAKILAKCLNCADGVTAQPCEQCASCKKIKNGYAIDVMEIDAASNRGIDEIRDLREKVNFLPSEGRYKVYIIDEVHMLTTEAFNALLKTLEEPPSHVVFILATTELHKIPATILSRCQCFTFKPISLTETVETLADIALKEGLEVSKIALNMLARNAGGGLRDAMSLLDQVAAFAGKEIDEQAVVEVLGLADSESLACLAQLLLARDSVGLMELINDLITQGKNLQQFVKGALGYFRDLLLCKVCGESEKLLELSLEEMEKLTSQAIQIPQKKLLSIIDILTVCENEMKYASSARWTLEVAFLKMLEPEQDEIACLLKRIEKLESMLENPAFVPVKEEKAFSQRKEKIKEVRQEAVVEKQVEVMVDNLPSLTFAQIEEMWPVVLEKVKKQKRTFHAYLLEGELKGLEGNNLLLSFRKKFIFHKENAEKPEVKKLVENVLQQTLHQSLQFKCILEDAFVQGEKKIVPVKKAEAFEEDDPLLKNILEVFEGEIIEIKEEG